MQMILKMLALQVKEQSTDIKKKAQQCYKDFLLYHCSLEDE